MNAVFEKVLPASQATVSGWGQPYFLFNFFLGGGLSYFYVSALSGFMYFNEPIWIPVMFLTGAALSLLIGRLYAYLEYFQSAEHLGKIILLSLFGMALVMHLITGNFESGWLFFIILSLHSPLHMMGNLLSWRIGQQVYPNAYENATEKGKATNGEVLGRLSAFLSIPLLLLVLQPSQLLLVACFAFAGSYYFNLQLQKQLSQTPDVGITNYRPSLSWKEEGKQLYRYYGNRGVLLVLPQVFFILAGAYITGFLLLDTSEAFFIEQDDYANFFGLIFSVSGIVTIGLKMMLPTKQISNIGLANSFIVVTMVLAGVLGLLFLLVDADSLGDYDLFFAAIVYIFFYSLYFTFLRPSVQALLNAVMQDSRFNVYTLQKCLTEPFFVLMVGTGILLTILISESVSPSAWLYFTEYFFFGWLLLTLVLRKPNIDLLRNAVKVRSGSLPSITLNDNNILSLIEKKLWSEHPEEAIYAVELLHKHSSKALQEKLEALLQHPLREVRVHLLQKEELLGAGHEGLLKNTLAQEPDDAVKKELILQLCRISGTVDSSLKPWAGLDNEDLKEAFLTAGWLFGKPTEKEEVRRELEHLVAAPSSLSQALSAKALARVGDPALYPILLKLLESPKKLVLQEALKAASQLQHEELIPILLEIIRKGPLTADAVTTLASYGEKALPAIREVIGNAGESPDPFLVRLCRTCGGIESPESHELLWWMLSFPWVELQREALAALKKSGYHAQDKREVQKVEAKLGELLRNISWIGNALWILEGRKNFHLLAEALSAELKSQQGKCRTLLYYLYRKEPENHACIRNGIDSFEQKDKEKALGLLSQKLPPSTAGRLCEALSKQYTYDQLSISDRFYEHGLLDETTVVLTILQDRSKERRFSRWTQAAALFCMAEGFYPTMAKSFLPYLQSQEPLLCQAAASTIRKFCQVHSFSEQELLESLMSQTAIDTLMEHLQQQNGNELLEIEKVIILKSTSLFSETPENILTDIAKIVREERVSEGNAIFRKGDEGNCMYVIYEGMVKIHIEDYRLNTLVNRDFFGELGLLDTNPRSASATAEKDTLLLRIDQDAFYDLMTNRPEVAKGVMRVLCNRIRSQDELITDLQKNRTALSAKAGA